MSDEDREGSKYLLRALDTRLPQDAKESPNSRGSSSANYENI